MSDLPSVSAVVATYNRRAMLPAYLDAVLADPLLAEVIVAVDGSDDGSMELAAEYHERDERVIPLWVEHRGQFGALDAGAQVASGEVLLFMDDDVIAGPHMATGHARVHAARSHVVALGYMPPVLRADPQASEFATILYAPEYEGRCQRYEQDQSSVLRHLWGGNFSLRKSDYERVAYVPLEPPTGSPDLRMYNQDRDFGLQCLAAGMSGVFDRSITARHLHERATAGFLRDALGQGACDVLLHAKYNEQLGELDLGRYGAGLPRPASRLVEQIAGSSAAGERSVGFSRRTIDALATTRSVRATVAAAKLARRVQQRRGAELMQTLLAGGGRTVAVTRSPS